MQEHFPVGAEIEVYYNPDKPKQNYVLRYKKNYTGWILIWIGLGAGVIMGLTAALFLCYQ